MNKRNFATATLLFASVTTGLTAAYVSTEAQATTEMSEFKYMSGYSAANVIEQTSSNRTTFSTVTISNETELIRHLVQNFNNLNTEFVVQYNGDKSNLMGILEKAIHTDDYATGVVSKYGYSYDGYSQITFKMTYQLTKEQQQFVNNEIARVISTIIKPGMSDLQKVQAINEYIVLNTTYSFNSKTTPHSAYALFKEGKGVCQAYAMAALQMFKAAGLEAHYVSGYTNEAHAWNLVKVDGEWYHIDPTWSDPLLPQSFPGLENYISYEYFLVSDAELLAGRKMDNRPGLPKATSERYKALRAETSTPLTFNNIPYLLTPEFVNDVLYYVNYANRSYAIHAIDLKANPATDSQFANVRAMDILATATDIYFVNVESRFGLSKINIETKQVTDLYNGQTVTSIKLENGMVNAYNNSTIVFSEKAPVEQTNNSSSQLITQIETLANSIVYLSKDFATQAERLTSLTGQLGASANLSLSQSTRNKVAEVQAKYAKMQSLAFNATTPWTREQTTTDRNKTWTITMTQDLANTQMNREKIRVVDMFGDPVAAEVTLNGKLITIKPTSPYVIGIPYTLIVENGLTSTGGKTFTNGRHMKFTVN